MERMSALPMLYIPWSLLDSSNLSHPNCALDESHGLWPTCWLSYVNASSSSHCSIQRVKSLTCPLFPLPEFNQLVGPSCLHSHDIFHRLLSQKTLTKCKQMLMKPEKECAFPLCKPFQVVLLTRKSGLVHVYLFHSIPSLLPAGSNEIILVFCSTLSGITGYRISSLPFTWQPMVKVFFLSSAVTFLMGLMLRQQNKTKFNYNKIFIACLLLTVLFI